MTQSLWNTNGIGLDILKTPLDEIIPPPPIQLPQYPYPRPRHPDATVLAIYQTLDDINAAGLGKWATPCVQGAPFELVVRIQDNGVLLYKLRCRECGRANGAIGHDNIPPAVRVRVGDEVPEPGANEEWYERDRYHHKISLAARNVDSG
jgi:hypothetical protein